MSVVTVNTETLEAGGSNVIKYYNENKECYDAVSGTSISSCASFDTFKGSLKSLFGTYTSHCNIMNENLKAIGKNYVWLKKEVNKFNINPEDALVVTFDGKGQIFCQEKMKKGK